MSGNPTESRPWDRLPEESPQAYAAFKAYRDLGETRSFIGTARALEKTDSLIRRWAVRHDWRARARVWDLAEQREQETTARRQGEDRHKRWTRIAEQVERLTVAMLVTFVRRNPDTGQTEFDRSLKFRDAVAGLKLALEIQDRIAAAAPPLDPYALERRVRLLSDDEAEEAIRFLDAVQENVREGHLTKEDER